MWTPVPATTGREEETTIPHFPSPYLRGGGPLRTDTDEAIAQFRTAIRDAGLTPPESIEPDGRLHRFSSNGQPRDDAGWYVLFGDEFSVGSFGCWRGGISQTWRVKGDHKLSPREQTVHRERKASIKRVRQAEDAKCKAEAQKNAVEIWRTSEPATDDHPYLVRKGVKAHGLRVLGDGRLVVPMFEGAELHSLQFISAAGKKKFLTGGRVRGCYFPIGQPDGIQCLAEGFATAATIYEATGHAVAVAFSASGLPLVARLLRAKYPDLQLIICADDDTKKDGSNPGMTAAQEAAREVDGPLAVPDFGDDWQVGASDFNDLAQQSGLEAVRICIERAEAVSRSEPVTPAGLLDAAGVTANLKGVDAATDALRQLVHVLKKTRADDLLRAGVREEAVNRLKEAGITASARMVDAALRARTSDGEDNGQGQRLLLTDPEPWDGPVDGADLIDEVARTIVRYVVLPEGAATAIALWVLFAHAHDISVVSPLLSITSPTKRCGKSTLMMLVSGLVPRPLPASNITAAALFRTVDTCNPTLLIDEADSFLNEHEELRGILNSGHTRAMAYVVRCDGDDHEARAFSTWCPKVLALIGQLPDTLADRSIVVPMRRQGRGERAERLRLDKLNLEDLRSKAARWAADNMGPLQGADPDVPSSLDDRASDNWRPLLAIADCVGADWPEEARRAAVVLSGAPEEDGATGTLLLGDLKRVFDEQEVDRLTSAKIVEGLIQMEERPWPEWRGGKPLTQRGLARLLGPFSVRPQQLWIDGAKTRGYNRDDFVDAWTRYLVPDPPTGAFSEGPPAPSGRSGRTRVRTAFQPDSQAVGARNPTSCENAQKPRQDCLLPVLPLANRPSETEVNEDGWTEV